MEEKIDKMFEMIQNLQETVESAKLVEKATIANDLIAENNRLKEELQKLKNKIDVEINTKKIVIYGFPEYRGEHQHETIQRVSSIFYELLDTDINGYIDDIKRIGRLSLNYHRPLVVDFISKRMVKYVLNNAQYLGNYGVRISAFMNEEQQQQLRVLKVKQREERSLGRHAIIRNMSLIVDGLEHKINLPSEVETPKAPENFPIKEQTYPIPSMSCSSTPNSQEATHTSRLNPNTQDVHLPIKTVKKDTKVLSPKLTRKITRDRTTKPTFH